MTPGIRVVLVDDHRILRDGLRLVLEREPGFKIVGEAGNVCGALECVRQAAPDLVVLDVQLPDGNGLDVARHILSVEPRPKILMLSADPNPDYINEALRMGVSGYLLKEEASNELLRAVQAVMSGKVYLCPSSATVLATRLQADAPTTAKTPARPEFSPRELEVLKLVVEGMRNKEIAERLGIGIKSVESYRARLMTKTGCDSPAELVRFAIREGFARL